MTVYIICRVTTDCYIHIHSVYDDYHKAHIELESLEEDDDNYEWEMISRDVE